ncbi:unnamed protein product [Nyctereutes procyonoides]|uniref:(raccoon dog) hypothetical protein n=1 Tax=Nyctereutes procyonoides TaxID=34880 RepID=A0A811YS55_NYCPR|nr:unnamed protein product [Nyctereutes procyonoides]
MQSNKTFNLEKQNHTLRKQQQHQHQQHQQHQQQQPPPPPPPPIPANGQQASSQNEGLTIDPKNFRKPGEKTFTQHSWLFVGNLPPDITAEEMRKLFEKYGKAGKVFIHKDKCFVEIAKVELGNMPLCGKQLHYVSNELLEEAFSMFGQVERAVVIVDDRGRPSGKGIVEFSGKSAAWKALDRCSEGSFLLTTFPRPVTQEQPPRFAQPGFLEYEYAMRWKSLIEMEKQGSPGGAAQDQVDHNIKEAREKLEMEMEAACHEHQVMMRQNLMRRQEELRRMEELHNQEMQWQQEEMMQRQQEGFKGTFPDAREQELWMGQMAMEGAMGINNRGATPPAPAATMEGIGAIGGTPPAFNRAASGAEFAPNKRR